MLTFVRRYVRLFKYARAEVVVVFKQIRKIVKYGNNSNGIVLPREWLDYYALVKGDNLIILGNGVLVVAPMHLEDKARDLIEQAGVGTKSRK